jgi:cytochrome P450
MTAVSKMTISPKGLGLVATALAALLYRAMQRLKSKPKNVTVVPSYWILGNLIEMLRYVQAKTLNQEMSKWHSKYGQTFVASMSFVTPWTIATTCPKNVEHILKTKFENYPKGSAFRSKLAELLGRGIFNSDGDEWHRQRKVSSHMFTAKRFQGQMWSVVRRNAAKLRDILESVEPGEPVDIFNLMNRFTLDTIGEIGFGKSIDSLGDPSSPFLLSFDRAQQILQKRFLVPVWQLLRLLGVGHERETRMHMERLNTFTTTIVRKLRASMERNPPKVSGDARKVSGEDFEGHKSFLALFMEDAQKRGEELSEAYLRDLVMNFLIAGRDTTAQALSWTIFCLSQHPEAVTKVRQEISDVCGIRGLMYEDMNQLPYLHAVISEALRLYPSVPVLAKVAADDDTWPDGSFVPKGTMVLYDIYSMGKDKHIWGDDADVFRPERWIEMKNPPTNYEYVVFNAGPRECLGRRLALIEMKICLATLLPSISFELAVPADQIIPDAQLTIGMGRGLPCFVVVDGDNAARKERAGSNVSTGVWSDDTHSITSEESEASADPLGIEAWPDPQHQATIALSGHTC